LLRTFSTSSTATLELAADFAKASKAPATQAAYSSDFRIFEPWCLKRGLSSLPASAESLCAFLADEASAGRRASTLGRRLAAVRYYHRAAGYEAPTADERVKAVLAGIRRTIGAAPVRKRAATSDIVLSIVSGNGTSLRDLRNRALVLLGFAGAFRRSELVALNVEDIEETPEGMLITLRRSKTDQEGLGRRVAIPRGEVACPVAALRTWRTPGLTRNLTVKKICNTTWGSDVRSVTTKMKKDVIAAYHFKVTACPLTLLKGKRVHRVEIDHLIPRSIGGADDVRNLWPQCYEPVKEDKSKQADGAHKKDRLETELHRRVCKAKSAGLLKKYQSKIRTNWISLYHEIYGNR
jgi:Phage integrase, N-terminal SAM-like domain